MDQDYIARRLRNIAMNMDHMVKQPMRPDLAGNYMRPWVEELRKLATAVEQLPPPGRMRDAIKSGRW